MLPEKMSERELAILSEVLHLRPLGGIATSYGLTESRVRQIFERALRRMVHFANDIRNNYLELEREQSEAVRENQRLSEELKRLRILLKTRPVAGNATSKLLGKKIEDVEEFSVRTINGLRAAGIDYVRHLIVVRRKDVMRYRNLGRKSLKEIDTFLDRYGLDYGMSEGQIETMMEYES